MGGRLEDVQSMRKLQICPISVFEEFAGILFKGINLVKQEYFVLNWLVRDRTKQDR